MTSYMRYALIILSILLQGPIHAQKPYFQQQVDHRIRLTLDDSLHLLKAWTEIDYTNHSPDTLTYIWFHLWPNAYKSERTAFGQQQIENSDTRFYFSKPEEKGYINGLAFQVDGKTAQVTDHPQHLDIIKLILPTPLLPQQKIKIQTPFNVQLPATFSRSGHGKLNIYQVTQWYPKPAVYDRDGWHPMPYLDQGEFYSEFGNYALEITLPEEYVVASTGILLDSAERVWLKSRGIQGNHGITSRTTDKKELRPFKTLHYRADSVHDIAWFASPNYKVQFDTTRLKDGSIKEIWHYHTNSFKDAWQRSIRHSKDALHYYSERIGSYPYPVISVVESADGPGGGMEYPMLSVIDPISDTTDLRSVIIHEIGHNWFYGALASNERNYPWLDEGLNSFYESSLLNTLSDPTEELLLQSLYQERKDQPIQTAADDFSLLNYAAIAYLKAAKWMEGMEKMMGKSSFDRAMQDYYRTWKFKHPTPTDLKAHLQQHSKADLGYWFQLLDKKGPLQPEPKRGWKWQSIFNWSAPANLAIKNQITVMPLIGYNRADGLQAGVGITNIKLPLNDLQWFIAPLYAIGSKQLNGIGFINHRWRPSGIWNRIDLGIGFSKFSFNRFTAPNGQSITQSFSKLSPGIRLTWKETARSTQHRHLQFSWFHFTETGYRFQRDTSIIGTDTTFRNYYRTRGENRSLAQVSYVTENNRKLYPYRVEIKLEGNKNFVRPTVTAEQFFNYPTKGGLQARFFAGTFFYLGTPSLQDKFRQSRYFLQMQGPTGMEDYTYHDYFVGRSAFEGFASQQIMNRDGAFKMRTDRLASPVGRSDRWLMALNLSSSVPDNLNPLRVLPIRIPLHVFVDIGASASADETQWLYVAGLELPFLQRNFRLFIPLLYSKPYRDYVQSILEPKKRFWQKISFQINLTNWNPRRLQPELDLW
ncbi:MAG: hypothetical protein RL447_405 [Bacteroidota bacterium]